MDEDKTHYLLKQKHKKTNIGNSNHLKVGWERNPRGIKPAFVQHVLQVLNL